jgi:hypothetical protein
MRLLSAIGFGSPVARDGAACTCTSCTAAMFVSAADRAHRRAAASPAGPVIGARLGDEPRRRYPRLRRYSANTCAYVFSVSVAACPSWSASSTIDSSPSRIISETKEWRTIDLEPLAVVAGEQPSVRVVMTTRSEPRDEVVAQRGQEIDGPVDASRLLQLDPAARDGLLDQDGVVADVPAFECQRLARAHARVGHDADERRAEEVAAGEQRAPSDGYGCSARTQSSTSTVRSQRRHAAAFETPAAQAPSPSRTPGPNRSPLVPRV